MIDFSVITRHDMPNVSKNMPTSAYDMLHPIAYEGVTLSDWQFSLRTLILTTTLVAFYFVATMLYRDWYKSAYPSYAWAENRASLENGQLLYSVSALFETIQKINPSDLVDLGPTQNGKILRPGGFTYASPSVIREMREIFDKGHELYSFTDRYGSGVHLQFSNGKLVNHPRGSSLDAIRLAQMNNFPIPIPALRFGILPYYIPIAISLILIDNRLQKRKIRQRLEVPTQSTHDML